MTDAVLALLGLTIAFGMGVAVGIGLQKMARAVMSHIAQSTIRDCVNLVEKVTPYISDPRLAEAMRNYVREMRETDNRRARRRQP